jgi:hypothetical protein
MSLTCLLSFQAVVECFRRGTPEDFWRKFMDDKGKYLSFTAIAARLTTERVKENQILAERARAEYGADFESQFSYRKGSVHKVMKDPTMIAKRYRQLHS